MRLRISSPFRKRSPVFTADWTSEYFPIWRLVLAEFVDRPVRVLEIGSYEGRSALFFLDHLPHSRVTCLDAFFSRRCERRFDANVRAYGKRVRKLKALSLAGLAELSQARQTFDVIYIDGSHMRADVLADSVAAWPLLETQGILIWDDYKWQPDFADRDRPEQAIDLFVTTFSHCCRDLHRGYQLIVRKTAEWPAEEKRMG
jgi:predicted O-methyltransferase YrrM